MALDRLVAMVMVVVAAMAVLPLAAAQDFKQVGCFVDDSVDRVFAGYTDPDPDYMTKRVCAARCESYPYYGLEYGVECWCGSYDEDDYDKYGESSDCTIPCSGNDNVSCGGEYAIRVFTQAKADPAAEVCVKDMRDPRVFQATYTDTTGLTPETCIAYCSSQGYYYAGTQWGEQCWCGHQHSDLDLHGYGSCNKPCSGDPTKFCGGLYEMNVYQSESRREDVN